MFVDASDEVVNKHYPSKPYKCPNCKGKKCSKCNFLGAVAICVVCNYSGCKMCNWDDYMQFISGSGKK